MQKIKQVLTVKNILIIGLFLRLILVTLDFSIDVNNHIAWGKETATHGFAGFYDRTGYETFTTRFPNYPPLILYVFTAGWYLYSGLFSLCWWINVHFSAFPSGIVTFLENRNTMAAFMKIPGVIGDLGVAYLVYLFTLKLTQKKQWAIGSMCLVAFNPVLMYISALWGQIDILPIMFMLWSIYMLLYTPQKIFPGVLFAFALLSKQTAVIYIPVYMYLVIKTVKPKEYFRLFALAMFIFWVAFLPFFHSGNILVFPVQVYIEKILFVSGIQFISNHAFNFWGFVSQWHDIPDTNLLLGVQYKIWGYVLSIPLLLAIFRKYIKSSLSLEKIFLTAVVWNFTVFLFFTRMHERHFLPVLIFLVPLIWKKTHFKYLFFAVSIFHMVNLYHNWAVPDIKFITFLVRSSITENIFIFSGFVIYCIVIREFFTQKSQRII